MQGLASRLAILAVVAASSASTANAYPLDEYERTGLRRLFYQQKVDFEGKRGAKNRPGAKWFSDRIKLRMLDNKQFELTAETPKDPDLQAALEGILKREKWKRYNIAILDITDPMKPRYAGVNETDQQTPGSVAKLLVGAGLLEQLRARFPDDIAAREKLLKETMVAADIWAMPNHHEVPVIYGENMEKRSIRKVKTGDTFSVWEWMDHMLSPSSNASASMTWREATLMKLLGDEYPPEKYDGALWKRWDRDQMTEAAFAVVDKPLIDAGLGTEGFYLRMFFTTKANRFIRSSHSRASPLALAQWMVRVEQGRMVDAWSSLELKKMLYLTRRRTRYVYAPELNDSAVWFKSGSLYVCKPEKGFKCGKYQGNVINVLNGLIEVETPPPPPPEPPKEEEVKEGEEKEVIPELEGPPLPEDDPNYEPPEPAYTPHVYIVAVMSNELKRNAALDHSRLAAAVHAYILGEK